MEYAKFVEEHFGKEYVFEIGDWAVTTKRISCFARHFDIGTRVQIIDVSGRGYDLMDENGNRIIETGWNGICKQ